MPKKLVQDFLYEKETYLIRKACFKIWKEFGGAFKEKVIDRALNEELKYLGLKVENQKSIDIYYRDKKIASYLPDKIVNDSILLEIKCKPFLTKEDKRQFWLYLKGSKYRLGLLINFGSKKLEIRRRIYDKAREKFQRKSALLSAFIGFYLAFSYLLTGYSVNAQEAGSLGLSVAPQIFELDVFPGEKFEQKINLRNLSDVPLPILVKVTDFTAEEDSGEMEFDESLQDVSIASRKWFRIENPNFILESREKTEVRFSIEVPENAEPGGHYSVILFEPQLPSFYFKPGQPRAIPVVGVLFLLSVKTLALEPVSSANLIEIAEFRIPKEQRITALENIFSVFQRSYQRLSASIGLAYAAQAPEITITEKSPSSFVLRIKNNDIFHHKLSGKLLIYNSFGKKVGESEIQKTTILPGKIRRFPVEFSSEIPERLKWLPASISNFLTQNTSLGKYRVVLEIGEEKSQIELNQTLNFWAFPWKIGLAIFPPLLTIVFAIMNRRRMKLAFMTLIRR